MRYLCRATHNWLYLKFLFKIQSKKFIFLCLFNVTFLCRRCANFFCPKSGYCQPAQNQPKSHILFLKDYSQQKLCILTLRWCYFLAISKVAHTHIAHVQMWAPVCTHRSATHTLPNLVKLDELVDEVFDAAKEAEPMLKKFVVRLLPALADAL